MSKPHQRTGSARATALSGLLIILCLGLAITDFVVHRHGYFKLEERSGFYPIVALLSCILIISIAKSARFMVKRSEDYYDK